MHIKRWVVILNFTSLKIYTRWVHLQPDQCSRWLCHRRLSISPSEVQKSLMAEVMNAAGFCSTKRIGYCRTKEQRQFEQLRVDEDVWEETIKDILKRMYTRRSARNCRLVCAVTSTGGCTKSFTSCVGLAIICFMSMESIGTGMWNSSTMRGATIV